ncbi:MAG: hypothetical protein HY670_06355 [Chloroflexi bacterium]|nr:hypothetical protein [Chloroflexota bacterium]
MKPDQQKKGGIKGILAEFYFDIILILIVVFIFIIPSFQIRVLSRQFPLALSFVVIGLIVIRVATTLARRLRAGEGAGIRQETARALPGATLVRRASLILLSLSGLLGIIYLLGMVLGGVIFTLLFTRFYGKQTWLASLIPALVTLVLVYGLFGILMNFQLYHGIFQIRLPGLV